MKKKQTKLIAKMKSHFQRQSIARDRTRSARVQNLLVEEEGVGFIRVEKPQQDFGAK